MYTQIPNGLSGALTAEAKDIGPSDTRTPWNPTQDTLTFCFKGQHGRGKQDLPFLAAQHGLSQIPRLFPLKSDSVEILPTVQAFRAPFNKHFPAASGAESPIFCFF